MSAPKGNKNHLKHGMRHTRIYGIWRSMRQRCLNPNCNNYMSYGGRGINICADWECFQTFLDWSMENGYTEELTIDRIDPNGNYEPSNCRWVSHKIQQNNRTNNRILEFNGVCCTLAEWSDATGIAVPTLWARLKRGWTIERTLSEPVQK